MNAIILNYIFIEEPWKISQYTVTFNYWNIKNTVFIID